MLHDTGNLTVELHLSAQASSGNGLSEANAIPA